MGRDLLIDKKVELATQALNAKLIAAAESMEKEFKKQQADFGTSPTDDQRARLKQLSQKIQETIQNNREIATQARQRVRLEQIQLFRNDVKTVAARIAEKHHAGMVMVAGSDLLWFTPSADITATVIAEMRTQALSISGSETQTVSTATETSPPPVTNASASSETNR